MASNVTADEARAIAQALQGSTNDAHKSVHVETRQFERPLRLSGVEIDALREKLRKTSFEVARELGGPMRMSPTLDLVELCEVNAESVHAGLVAPFAVLRFEIDKQPGWLMWDCPAALATLDVALGAASPGQSAARKFTPIERAMFTRILGPAVARLTKALGLTIANPSVAQDLESLGSWRQGGDKAETQRLLVSFDLGGVGGTSRWRLFLPGVVPSNKSGGKPEKPPPLPAHLAEVLVDVKAHLGANDVPLADLLALEVGDVIPLRMEVGEPLRVLVEDQGCLRAVLGRSHDKLAIRVTQVERPKSDG